MSRHDRDPKRKSPPPRQTDWVAPTFQERQVDKAKRLALETGALSLDQELALAAFDRSLPQVDFHGLTRGDVPFEIDRLVRENPGRCVRIIYGHGRGIMANEVMSYVHRMQIRRNSPVLGLREDANMASVIVRVK
ncbi:MAG: hypothetical protein ACD_41C00001G0003 [uncultured bacterium]|nr:MAG: hypothetical protein ACD_41C00001G0003 [uncultured bacterium]HBY73693.1 hypothetical protein [Candidatus Kerfeldbacteria bacterium]